MEQRFFIQAAVASKDAQEMPVQRGNQRHKFLASWQDQIHWSGFLGKLGKAKPWINWPAKCRVSGTCSLHTNLVIPCNS